LDKFGKLVSLLILPLIAQIIYGALMSYFYRAPPDWGPEVTLFLYGCFFMLGAAYCYMHKKHVAVDTLVQYVGPKKARVLSIFQEIVVLFVVIVMIYFSFWAAYRSTLIGERSLRQTPWNPQTWWFRWIIPISCALISWQAFKNLLRLIMGKDLIESAEKRESEHNAA